MEKCAQQIGKDITRHYANHRAREGYQAKHIPGFRSGPASLIVWGAIVYGDTWQLMCLPLSPLGLEVRGYRRLCGWGVSEGQLGIHPTSPRVISMDRYGLGHSMSGLTSSIRPLS
jgi:hypothetical protein